MIKRIHWFLIILLVVAVSFLWLRRASVVSAFTATELRTYIYGKPVISYSGAADDIVAKIRSQVGLVTTANRHDLIGARAWGTANQLLWGHGRAVAALSKTFPYLDTANANALKTFLQSDINSYLLSSSAVQSEISGSVGKNGSTGNYGFSWSNNHAFCWEAIYGIWAYGHFANDSAFITSKWSNIKTIYNLCSRSGVRYMGTTGNPSLPKNTAATNSEIAGTIAMVRMAVIAGDTTTENSAASTAVTLLNNKSSAVAAMSDNPVTLMDGALARFLYINGYQDMTMDLARFLKDKNQAKVTTQFNTVTNRFRTWYLGDLDHVSDWMSVSPFPPVDDGGNRPGEEGYQMSLFAHPIYMARAYITDTSVATLRKELPFAQTSLTTPSFLDMYRLEYLVALAHRSSSIVWQ